MRNGVAGPVGRQQEGLDIGGAGVVGSCGPELEEVKGREGGEEEGQTPERARGVEDGCAGCADTDG